MPTTQTKSKLTKAKIRGAIRTVHVTPGIHGWRVKRTTSPTVWTFSTRKEAIEKAKTVAAKDQREVVVLGRSGKILQSLKSDKIIR